MYCRSSTALAVCFQEQETGAYGRVSDVTWLWGILYVSDAVNIYYVNQMRANYTLKSAMYSEKGDMSAHV